MTSRVIAEGFYALLTGDATLTALLSTYEGSPAVFTFDPVPEDAVVPYIQARGETRSFKADGLDQKLREFSRTIDCYAAADGNPLAVSDIADRVVELFTHPSSLAISGYNVVGTFVDGPVIVDSDTETYGRSVEVRVLIYPSS